MRTGTSPDWTRLLRLGDARRRLDHRGGVVGHPLRLLREAGLIDCERQGLWAYYFVQRDALTALRTRISHRLAALA